MHHVLLGCRPDRWPDRDFESLFPPAVSQAQPGGCFSGAVRRLIQASDPAGDATLIKIP